jgi:hypothetical protein
MANTVGQIAGNVTGSVGGLLGGSSTDPHQATPAPGATPAPATPPATLPSCKLDYQRADNMWAAAGRPDGNLGTESIAEAYGQTKVFITDWAYEKRVNDGNNYYGSHLRIATNTGAGVVALRLNNPTAALFGGVTAGVAQKLGTGALVGFVVMKPGERQGEACASMPPPAAFEKEEKQCVLAECSVGPSSWRSWRHWRPRPLRRRSVASSRRG